MDRIDLFRIFVRVVDCASFTGAADRLGLPRSSVSAAVQELEARVGTRLLHRTTRRVTPTQDGLVFAERCRRLVADVEETESFFRQSETGLTGRLRVDVPGRIGRLIVAPALPEFLARHPGIDITLGVGDRAVDLFRERVDLVLRIGADADPGLTARPLGEILLVNVASPAYLAAHGTPATPADLADHLVVDYASPSTGRVAEWEWEERGETRTLPLRSRVTVDNAEAYIACCLAGLGLIQVPAYDVAEPLTRGDLVEVMPDHRAAPMPMTLLHPHGRQSSRRLRVFADWLEALLCDAIRPQPVRQSSGS